MQIVSDGCYSHTCKFSSFFTDKNGKVYSLEYTDIPKVLFTPYHVSHCCTVTRVHFWEAMCSNNDLDYHCYVTMYLGHCCINDVRHHCYAAVFQQCFLFQLLCNNDLGRASFLPPVRKVTDKHGLKRRSLLTLQRENIKTEIFSRASVHSNKGRWWWKLLALKLLQDHETTLYRTVAHNWTRPRNSDQCRPESTPSWIFCPIN
jgi:hypothetical protein